MFEIYLNNLYRNLNLYNIQNSEKYTEFYKTKIKHMMGGAVDLEKVKKLKELSLEVKTKMEELKNKKSSTGNNITIDAEKFKAMTDLILYTTRLIERDHELVKQSIDKMNTTVDSDEFKNIQQTIDEINSMFAQLLN